MIRDQAEQLHSFVTGASTLLQQVANAERKAANGCFQTAKKTKDQSVLTNELDRAITYLKLSWERRTQGAAPGLLREGGLLHKITKRR